MINRAVFIFLFFSGIVKAEIVQIPSEDGFSGFFMAGGGTIKYKSNMFKGPNDNNSINHGLSNAPESHNSSIPIYGIDLRYTFAPARTQLFFGNPIQDALRFDFTQQLGIRHQLSDKTIIAISYVFPLMPNEAWADPYARGKRDTTEMSSSGFRIGMDKIFGYPFNFSYTARKLNIDEERSGESLNLSASEKNLIKRDGYTNEISLSYDLLLEGGQLLHPEVSYMHADMDGDAMSYDKAMIQVSHGYTKNQFSIITNVFEGVLSYDEVNPVFGNKSDAIEKGIKSTLFWRGVGSVKNINLFVSFAYSKSKSDISFYDSYAKTIGVGALYRF